MNKIKNDKVWVIFPILISLCVGVLIGITIMKRSWHYDYKEAWKAEHHIAYTQFELLHKCMWDNKAYWRDSIIPSNEYQNWLKAIEGDYEDFYANWGK